MRNIYSEDVCDTYWKERFGCSRIGTLGFNKNIKEYLLWGFELEKLCSFIDCGDKEGRPQYEKFINCILETKIHWKEKDCEDILEIDQEEPYPYSIYTLMIQFAYAGAQNKKVDRYISIDEIRNALKRGLGEKCDVDSIVNEYLANEAKESSIKIFEGEIDEKEIKAACERDASQIFRQAVEKKRQFFEEMVEKYDICDYEDFIYYEKGDTIYPILAESLEKSYAFYHSIISEDNYKKLMEDSEVIRCEWIAMKNRNILIRDKDWNKIFTDIQENKDSFERYYPMVRVQINSEDQLRMITAIVLNDELYDYCRECINR